MEIKALTVSNLDEVENLYRVAFSKHIGIVDPTTFSAGSSLKSRFEIAPDGAFGTFIDNKLVAAIFCTAWGSFGFLGPLVVLPEYWGNGLAKPLIQKSDQFYEDKEVDLAGLYTFSNSPKHIALYQKFGYWSKQLTMLMSAIVSSEITERQSVLFSELDAKAQSKYLESTKQLCDGIYKGLDVSCEIKALATCKIGNTLFIEEDGAITGFAVCHYGHGSEATSNNSYIKFAAATNQEQFSRLLDQCLKLSSEAGVTHMVAGVNTARHEAYVTMLESGFKIQVAAVAMLRSQHDGFNRPGAFVIDDWR